MADVVVLPCAPATATTRRPRIRAASATERCSTGMPRSRARTTSGFVGRIAEETTSVSAPSTCAASWPIRTVTPAARSAAGTTPSRASEPETCRPRAASSRAMADMPTPPTPTRCTWPEELGHVHLVGVGGVGMSAIALLLAARGLQVSGSDARDGVVPAALRAAGVTVQIGHDAAHVEDADTLVVSSAIRPTNPEVVRARERGIPVLHRSVALAALMRGRRAVAVAGAHGKTTTSAMIAGVLVAAGQDPSFAIGAAVDGPVGARSGRSDVFVAEADESDGSFLAYTPQIAVVTNVEPDHLDHYGTREAFEQAFVAFTGRIARGGWLVACADDPGSRGLAAAARDAGVRVRTYGTAPDADVRVGPWHPDATGGSVEVRGADGVGSLLELRVPGAHNALNAAARPSRPCLLYTSDAADE